MNSILHSISDVRPSTELTAYKKVLTSTDEEDGDPFVDETSAGDENDPEYSSRIHSKINDQEAAQPQWRCLPCMGWFILSSFVTGMGVLAIILAQDGDFGGSFQIQDRPESNQERPTLKFREDPQTNSFTFKIVQITDIHLGEAEDLEWGPEQDRKTWQVLDVILTEEAPIDLLVLGGDQLTANDCKNNATAYYQELGAFLTPYNIPWALIFGNHDDLHFEKDGQNYPPAKYSRRDLMAIDQSFPLSLSKSGPENVTGTSNYVLDVFLQSNPAAQVFFLDSGGGSIPKVISDSQVEWFRDQASQSDVPAMAFQHIPTQAHIFDEDSCEGFHDDGVEVVGYDGGITEAIAETGRFFVLGVGHMHGNDYCCSYQGTPLHVCFGRHSGYGGYGRWDRGSRVYELSIPLRDEGSTGEVDNNSNWHRFKAEWSSWVRLESGEVVDRVSH